MADYLKIQVVANFLREDPAETIKLLDKFTQQEATEYHRSEIVLDPSTADEEICGGDTNICYIYCDDEFTIKIGGTGETAQTAMRSFGYNGTATKFYVTNPSTTASIKLYLVTGTIA